MRAGTTVSTERRMPVRDLLLTELDLEATYTRRHLERVPMTTLGFKPHSKSMSLGDLATFIAVLPTWGQFALTTDSFDVAPEGAPLPPTDVVRSRDELLDLFDRNMLGVRGALSKASDVHLQKPWSLVANRSAIESKVARLSAYCGFAPSFDAFLEAVLKLRSDLGVPHTLKDLKVPSDRRKEIAVMAVADPSTGTNPVTLDEALALRIFDMAMDGRLS